MNKHFGLFIFCLLFIILNSQAQIKSDFSSDDDGWGCFDLSTGSLLPLTWNAAGGNPGGNVSFTTSSPATGYYFFNAPSKFNGNLSASYNQNLSFDETVSLAGADNTYQDVEFQNNILGLTLIYQLPAKPGAGSWSSYIIPMNETATGWHIGFAGGAAPTKDQMKQVLGNVTLFQIRVKYTNTNTGPYTASLDNVILNVQAFQTPPTVTSISPQLGLPNATITIAGTNFNSSIAQNVVFFGSVKASIITASPLQLTVKVPGGAQFGRITVLNLGTQLSAESSVNFSPQFNNNKDFGGRIIPSSFAPKIGLPVDASSPNINTPTVGDIDGDGWNDLITSELSVKQIAVWRNLQVTGSITSASFSAKQTFPLAYIGKGHTILKDFDGDGKLDLAVGCNDNVSTSYIAIFRNTSVPGTISFENPTYMLSWFYSDGPIHAADVDGDGRPDILHTWDNSSGAGTSFFTIFQNLSTPGDIEFAAYQSFDFGVVNIGGEISTGDLDGDQKLDIVFPAGVNAKFYVFQNTSVPGTISLQAPFELNVGGSANNVALADLDNDGKLDLAWSGYNTNSLLISKNISSPGVLTTSSFGTPITITSPLGYIQEKVAVADFNGDSKPDIVLTGSTDIAVFQNQSTPGVLDNNSFIPGTPLAGYQADDYLTGAVVADLDMDGKADIITAETAQTTPHHIMIYHNECFPVPIINSLSPTPAATGGVVTLSGDLMQTGSVASPVIVRDGFVKTTSSTTSNTTTTVTLPSGVKDDKLELTVHGLTTFSNVLPVTFPTARIIDATSFASPINFPLTAATPSRALLTADWDDDGKSDVAVIGTNGTIFQNIQTIGSPISSTSLTQVTASLTAYNSLIAFDIEGDGKTDLLSYSEIYQNTSSPGTIAFAGSPTGIQDYFTSAAPADFNKDGKLDLAMINGGPINIMENFSAQGQFVSNGYLSTLNPNVITFTRSGNNGAIITADLDGDGFDDIITADQTSSKFSYIRNLGMKSYLSTASFSPIVSVTTSGISPNGIVAKDFDGDGKIDLAISYNSTSTFISIYKNTSTIGAISFAANLDFACLSSGYDLTAQDLDGDGKSEIISIHQVAAGKGSFSVFQNASTSGTVNFAAAVNYPLFNTIPQGLGIADINLDNKPDILISASTYPSGTSNVLAIQNNIASITLLITTQPSDVSICKNTMTTFTTAASGTTNINYKWQRSPIGPPLSFSDITDGNGLSGSASTVLSVNTSIATNADQFRYRCKVGGDFVTPAFTNDVGITYTGTLFSQPTVTNATGCPGASVTLVASGGSNGQYLWYTTATGGTASATQTNDTFITPELNSSTTYYVSLANGACESARVAVIATIKSSCENPPVIKSESVTVAIGEMISIPLVPLISDPDNNIDLTKLKIVSPPKSGASATIDAQDNLIINFNHIDFAGLDSVQIEVCDLTELCVMQEILVDVVGGLIVYNGISPADHNNLNDKWIIGNIDILPDARQNHVAVFNRWGDKVFDVDDYDNNHQCFSGQNNNGGDLPTGIYFYKISFLSNRKTLTGYLSLKR